MDFTVEISKAFGLSPFHVLNQDKDNVIMMINYYIEKGETIETDGNTRQHTARHDNMRIRVNDKTATGGWF